MNQNLECGSCLGQLIVQGAQNIASLNETALTMQNTQKA
jgi:hypothetical protein